MELRGRGWLPAAKGSERQPAGGGGVGAPRSAALGEPGTRSSRLPLPLPGPLETPSLPSSRSGAEEGLKKKKKKFKSNLFHQKKKKLSQV